MLWNASGAFGRFLHDRFKLVGGDTGGGSVALGVENPERGAPADRGARPGIRG